MFQLSYLSTFVSCAYSLNYDYLQQFCWKIFLNELLLVIIFVTRAVECFSICQIRIVPWWYV